MVNMTDIFLTSAAISPEVAAFALREPVLYNALHRMDLAPVMKPQKALKAVSLGLDSYPQKVLVDTWLIGGYLENRKGMYISNIYNNMRYIHTGVDIWADAGEPVFAMADGEIFGVKDNNNALDYGPTVIVKHDVADRSLYALYGHLSRESIAMLSAGQAVKKGTKLAELGTEAENGGWVPHLHFMISFEEPSDIDMPGVCAPDEVLEISMKYPDPRLVLGPLY